jgi:chemotaxis protein methyltransferase CheR
MKATTLPAEAVDAAAEEVRQLTGLVFQPSRRADFAGALAHAMRRAGTRETGQYLERLHEQPPLLDDLIAEITVGETYFFRDPHQLQVVRDLAIDRFEPDRKLRLWSAGCATGEEPYTLAMMLREAGRESAAIVGTDLSRSALTRARAAQYSRWSLRGVSEQKIKGFFEADGKQSRPVRSIRDAVEFRYLNLAEDTYPSLAANIWHMDVILCRNVLIYLDQATVAKVAIRLLESLSPDGWLFLGGADPLLGNLVPCEVITTDSGLAYRRQGAAQPQGTTRQSAPAPAAPADPIFAASREPVDAAPSSWPAAPVAPGPEASNTIREIRQLANSGEIELATRLCDRALERFRESAELYYLHGVLLAEAGRYDAAAQAARRALYLDRELIVAHLSLGGSLSRSGDRRGAHIALQNAARLLAALPADAVVAASDGERASRLATMARMQLQLLEAAG